MIIVSRYYSQLDFYLVLNLTSFSTSTSTIVLIIWNDQQYKSRPHRTVCLLVLMVFWDEREKQMLRFKIQKERAVGNITVRHPPAPFLIFRPPHPPRCYYYTDNTIGPRPSLRFSAKPVFVCFSEYRKQA